MYSSKDRLIIFDADGTTIDAFSAIDRTFSYHGMDIGDLERFQKRRALFKYLGGLKEFPVNLRKQFGKQKRKQLLSTLTEVYRQEVPLYPGVAELLRILLDAPGVRVALVTRNVTIEPELTLKAVFSRHGIDVDQFDHLARIPVSEDKAPQFRLVRENLGINPARGYACGDEHKDYLAATATGLHPFIVSYGFEDHKRLTQKFRIPEEVISPSPEALCARVLHALDLGA